MKRIGLMLVVWSSLGCGRSPAGRGPEVGVGGVNAGAVGDVDVDAGVDVGGKAVVDVDVNVDAGGDGNAGGYVNVDVGGDGGEDGSGGAGAGGSGDAGVGGPKVATLALPGGEARVKAGPLADGEAARWAFERLAPDHPEQRFLQALLVEVEASRKGGAEAAVERLVAALAQLLADETNGRDRLEASPFWGASPASGRRELRSKLVALIRSRHGDRAGAALTPVVSWLLFEERDLGNVEAGVTLLRVLPKAARRPLVERLLCEPSPVVPALVAAIELARREGEDGSLCLGQVAPLLTAHPNAAVRAAAKGLHRDGTTPFAPAIALLDELAAMAPFEVPAGAALTRFEARPLQSTGRAEQVDVHEGYALAELADGKVLRVGTSHGQVVDLDARLVAVTRAPLSLDGLADALVAARRLTDREARAAALSSSGMLTGQFEPDFISVREALVAHWLDRAGRRARALELLTPRFGDVADMRWPRLVLVDLFGALLHERMLIRWTLERDLDGVDGAIALARRLTGPAFATYGYQARTEVLLAQLEQRRDDWTTFTLPTRAAWERLRTKLSRAEQVAYLAERLRLRNTRQWGQPGGVDLLDAQYDRPLRALDFLAWDARPVHEVVNPINELIALRPVGEERAILTPYTGSPAFMAMYSYWRDFHPARTLHTVGEATTWLLSQLDAPPKP